MSRLRRFLGLAAMNETALGPGRYWGLTQVTAHDEMLLLDLLTAAEPRAVGRVTVLPAGADGPGDPVAAVGYPGGGASTG